jgi:hypothetical protein
VNGLLSGRRIGCGGVRVLVGPLVFKTSEVGDPGLAGSIPVRLRYQRFNVLASTSCGEAACLLARSLARF